MAETHQPQDITKLGYKTGPIYPRSTGKTSSNKDTQNL